MELLDLTATIHFDTTELDVAIEKVNRLISLLEKAREMAGSQDRGEKTGRSYGFRSDEYDQIIVFNDEQEFKEIVAANPRMTAIMGADDQTREEYPGVFIAGLVEYLPADKTEAHL